MGQSSPPPPIDILYKMQKIEERVVLEWAHRKEEKALRKLLKEREKENKKKLNSIK
jgi:hypothetical protein